MLENIILKISNEPNFDNIGNILKDYNDIDWKQYVKIDDKRYCRNKIFENDNFEIFVISWNKNQNAPIHDHSCNGCWLKVLSGELIENRYKTDSLELYQSNFMKTNDVSFMKNDIGYHSILNASDEIAITFHVYNPPNHKTKFFI
jgi:cysteine dioxygenase